MPSLSRPCALLLIAALTLLGAAQPAVAEHRPAVVAAQLHHSAPLHPGSVHGEPVHRAPSPRT